MLVEIFFYLCILMIKIGLYINGLLKFWNHSNFVALSHCLNGLKDEPGLSTGKGREKSGESEENRERDIEGDTCHVCIEREKKILSNSQLAPAVRHCNCCCYCAGWKFFFICVF